MVRRRHRSKLLAAAIIAACLIAPLIARSASLTGPDATLAGGQ
jgi:hypothetical protein